MATGPNSARGSVNGLGQGLHGDVTTTGAVCISSLPNATQSGRGVLRLGDETTPCPECGKEGVIVESLPAMKWMGVPTVLDGATVHCGCPEGRNRLIAPLQTRATPPAARVANPTANSAGQPPATPSHSAGSKATDKTAGYPGRAKADPTPCNHPDQMEELAEYIAGEMNRNIFHSTVLKMKELLSYDVVEETRKQMQLPWYAKIGMTNPQGIGAAKTAAAMAMWTERVGQGRPWDHKLIIRTTIGGIWHKQGQHDYFYDIWSNIHYGYVGVAGGLSEGVLLDGAGAEQIVSDSIRKVKEVFNEPEDQWKLPGPNRSADIEGLRAWDDTPDRNSINIGMRLFSQHPTGGITAKMLMTEVLALPPKAWGTGIREHECK